MYDEDDEDEDEFLDEYEEEDGEEETGHNSRSRSTNTPGNLTQRRLRAQLMKQYRDNARRRAGRVPRGRGA